MLTVRRPVRRNNKNIGNRVKTSKAKVVTVQLWNSIKRLFSGPSAAAQRPAPFMAEPEPKDDDAAEEENVPERTPEQVQQALASGQPLWLLDVREQYEWNQVHIADAHHIPMDEVAEQLALLPQDRPVVVFCAHGSRSWGVAHYLRQQGYEAYNMTGGITRWHVQGGPVAQR